MDDSVDDTGGLDRDARAMVITKVRGANITVLLPDVGDR
jgi:hypothetical protein